MVPCQLLKKKKSYSEFLLIENKTQIKNKGRPNSASWKNSME